MRWAVVWWVAVALSSAYATGASASSSADPFKEHRYRAWFIETTNLLSERMATGGTDARRPGQASLTEVLARIDRTSPPRRFAQAHRLLRTAAILGRVAATTDGTPLQWGEPTAVSGARLLLAQALDQLERPRSRVEYSHEGLSVEAADEPLQSLLEEIERQGGIVLDGRTQSDTRVGAHFERFTLARGLEVLLAGQPHGLLVSPDGAHVLLESPPRELAASATAWEPVGNTVTPPPLGHTTEALAIVLEHEDAEVRLQAIKTLELLGGQEATQLLEYAWARDSDPGVRDAAWGTLERLLARSRLPD